MSLQLTAEALTRAVADFKPGLLPDQELLEEVAWNPAIFMTTPATIATTDPALTCLRAMAELESNAIPAAKLRYLEIAITSWLNVLWEGHSILSISRIIPRVDPLVPPVNNATLQEWSTTEAPGAYFRVMLVDIAAGRVTVQKCMLLVGILFRLIAKSEATVRANIVRLSTQLISGMDLSGPIHMPPDDLFTTLLSLLMRMEPCSIILLYVVAEARQNGAACQAKTVASFCIWTHLAWKRFTIISLWKRASAASDKGLGEFLTYTKCGGVIDTYVDLDYFWKTYMTADRASLTPFCKLVCPNCFIGLSLRRNEVAVQLFMCAIDPNEPSKENPLPDRPSVWSLQWQGRRLNMGWIKRCCRMVAKIVKDRTDLYTIGGGHAWDGTDHVEEMPDRQYASDED